MPIKVNITGKIRFNGVDYDSLEAMPPEVREKVEAALTGGNAGAGQVVIKKSTKVVFNGHEYASVDEMPEDVRGQYRQIMGAFDKDGDGIPDMLEGGRAAATQAAPTDGAFPESAPLIPQAAPGAARRPSRDVLLIVLAVLGAAILILLLALVLLR